VEKTTQLLQASHERENKNLKIGEFVIYALRWLQSWVFDRSTQKKNYPRNITAKFDFKWFSGFREELFKIAQVQSGLLFNYVIPLQLC